ncbi:hypothetical protein BBJ28_00006685 [Nothophytophthora sp. Chile5]|nr:hypothetical protein BBJ28_00006685 [Nothophytophthora sp. Chile5]
MEGEHGNAARLAARYDRLIAAFGEDPFRPSSGVCARAEDASATISGAVSDEQRQQLLAAATDKSMRCAELIAQTLEASAALSRLQKTLVEAGEDDDESMDSEAEEDEEEEDKKATLLLQDLVAAGDEMEDAGKQCARLGVVNKTAHVSRELLATADRELQLHLATDSGDAAVQNEFRELYMEEFTSAFGDELDQFRQEERFESKDVTYLISCIHAGGDVFSPLQKKLFVESVGASRTS